VGAGIEQAPALLQAPAGVDVPLAQVAARQPTSAAGNAHWPDAPVQLPAHRPSPPHAPRLPCGVPLIVVQVPSADGTSQAMHWLWQASLQQ